jgi:hypothetical protein
MQTTTYTPAMCDDDFHPFGHEALDAEGTFISSRLLDKAELEEAWAAHRAKVAL